MWSDSILASEYQSIPLSSMWLEHETYLTFDRSGIQKRLSSCRYLWNSEKIKQFGEPCSRMTVDTTTHLENPISNIWLISTLPGLICPRVKNFTEALQLSCWQIRKQWRRNTQLSSIFIEKEGSYPPLKCCRRKNLLTLLERSLFHFFLHIILWLFICYLEKNEKMSQTSNPTNKKMSQRQSSYATRLNLKSSKSFFK